MSTVLRRRGPIAALVSLLVGGVVTIVLLVPGAGPTAAATGVATRWTGPAVAATWMPLVAPAGTVLRTRAVTVGGLRRTSVLVAPRVPARGPLPLVVVLHGRGQSPGAAVTVTGLGPLAARGRALLLYPEGLDESWNAGHGCCGPAALRRPDDAAFVDAAVADVREHADVDPRRIALVGYSNGGKLAYGLTCDPSQPFAALATYGAVPLGDCDPARPPRPVSYLLGAGTADTVMPLAGRPGGPAPEPSVADGTTRLLVRDRCAGPPVRGGPPDAVGTTWTCAGGTRVVLLTYPGHGHAWPAAPRSVPFSTVIGTFLDATVF